MEEVGAETGAGRKAGVVRCPNQRASFLPRMPPRKEIGERRHNSDEQEISGKETSRREFENPRVVAWQISRKEEGGQMKGRRNESRRGFTDKVWCTRV